MQPWKAGDRVHHATYGAGTVTELTDQHTIVHFDVHGRRKFASHLVVFSSSKQQAQAPQARRSGITSERTTDVGYENLNEQTVIRVVGHERQEGAKAARHAEGARPEESHRVQAVYVLKCLRCGAEYGVKSSDIHLRRCPGCMDAPPGIAIPD